MKVVWTHFATLQTDDDSLLRVLEASRAQLAPTERGILPKKSRAQLAPTERGILPKKVASTTRSYRERLLSITENLIKHKSNIYVKI